MLSAEGREDSWQSAVGSWQERKRRELAVGGGEREVLRFEVVC